MNRPAPIRLLATAACCLLVACSGSSSALQRSRELAIDGNYYLALAALEDAGGATSGDPELFAAWREARLDYLVHESQRLVFLDREEDALELLAEASETHPDNQVVSALVVSARGKLAQRATALGNRSMAFGEPMEALKLYQEATAWVPDHKPALEGIERVRATFAAMHLEAQQHFLEAVRRFPELRWVEVDWHASAALEKDPSREDAKDLRTRAARQLAQKTLDRARLAEEEGYYGAALMEYRSARKLDPSLEAIDDRIAHMEKEVQAGGLLAQAMMHSANNRFDKARAMLEEAFVLTVLEKAVVNDALLQNRRREAEVAYQQARDLELQGRKAEALAGYEALEKAWPDGLLDVKARCASVRSEIAEAEKAWAAGEAAEAAKDMKAALEAYQGVELFYPGYKDVRDRIQRIKAAMQAPATNG